jgi:hypothetical protein
MENIEIKPLSLDVIDDYFDFFDHTAFSDHEEWSWCYCTFYHFDKPVEAELDGAGKEGLRNYAERLIRDNVLRGKKPCGDDAGGKGHPGAGRGQTGAPGH